MTILSTQTIELNSGGQLTIPNWGLYMMMTASAIGTYLLARQLNAKGWPRPWGT